NEISPMLIQKGFNFVEAIVYRTVANGIEEYLKSKEYDAMIFFSPFGIEAVMATDPNFKQGNIVFGGFGNNTHKAIEEKGFTVSIKAPVPNSPSMVSALDKYLAEFNK